ncbi:MAG: hypothetical protein Q7T55_09880 [Solirubrobacteraceae bacterium]|nr:hypothetical protein [Solirubrobacteraceae bacterium]
MHKHRALLIGAAVVALSGSFTACGADGPSKEEIAAQIDANPNAGAGDPFGVSEVKTLQQQADDDAKAAALAKKRRADLAKLDKSQKEETDRILNGEGAPGGTLEDSSVPLGTADRATAQFRAKLAGVCDGTQQRLGKVTLETEKAANSKNLRRILESAQDYTDVLNDFQDALLTISPPPGLADEYADWRDTIDTLSSTIRLQLVSQGDRREADRLQKKAAKLTARFLDRSARLGITCISILG